MDAYICFMATEMDVLIIEDFVYLKEEQLVGAGDEKWKINAILD